MAFSLLLYANTGLHGAIQGMQTVLRALGENGALHEENRILAILAEHQRLVDKARSMPWSDAASWTAPKAPTASPVASDRRARRCNSSWEEDNRESHSNRSLRWPGRDCRPRPASTDPRARRGADQTRLFRHQLYGHPHAAGQIRHVAHLAPDVTNDDRYRRCGHDRSGRQQCCRCQTGRQGGVLLILG